MHLIKGRQLLGLQTFGEYATPIVTSLARVYCRVDKWLANPRIIFRNGQSSSSNNLELLCGVDSRGTTQPHEPLLRQVRARGLKICSTEYTFA